MLVTRNPGHEEGDVFVVGAQKFTPPEGREKKSSAGERYFRATGFYNLGREKKLEQLTKTEAGRGGYPLPARQNRIAGGPQLAPG